MKIIGGKVVSVQAERMSSQEFKGFEVNVRITDVKEAGKLFDVHYHYVNTYRDNYAKLTIDGVIQLDLDSKEQKKVLDEWAKSKQLPLDVAEEVLMAINYSTSTVGTLLAFAINVNSPISISRTRIMPPLPGQKAG
ncbi:TPA: hypothetical protein HA244_00010 [Candidatus Micrarchaeota archaeon]|nr:hypothetical protein [Candidatus Micrarchaeota archaeon]